jgi:4'-phosphopantetheinyl transferase EntD
VTPASAVDPLLARELAALSPPGLLIGHRVILPGDEHALLAEEAASIASSVIAVRRASGAARIVARELLAALGHAAAPVPRGASGEPVWPVGIVGSLAHDEEIAVAAVARRRDFAAVGIDVESSLPLPPELRALVATQQELRGSGDDPMREKLLFAAKEAVYKAAFPLDRIFLEFHDIEVDLAAGCAVTRTGRVLALRHCVSSHVLALALCAHA